MANRTTWRISDRDACVVITPAGDRVVCELSDDASKIVEAMRQRDALLAAAEAMLDDWDTAFEDDYNRGDPDAVRIRDNMTNAIAAAKEVA